MNIRPERPEDQAAIHALTKAAFAAMPYSSHREAEIVDALRATGALTLSLLAEENGEILGHVAFSPVGIEGTHEGWFGLGPVSVRPDRQRQGIGRALIGRGLETLEAQGASGCALVGDPDYYRRFGFRNDGALRHDGLDSHYVQYLVFRGPAPQGSLDFAPAFAAGTPSPTP